jgi:3-dehydroquinate dehydratase/shikimate dehydrogenase
MGHFRECPLIVHETGTDLLETTYRQDKRRLIGVALGAKTMAEALDALPRIAAAADIVEYRLDYFEEPYDLRRLLRERPIPVIVTNRPPREGGHCNQSDAERLAVLHQAAEFGADYVDVEWDAATPKALAPLKANGAQVIISRHSFPTMPADFVDWVDLTLERGADVVKTVGMANRIQDTLPVFASFSRSPKPTISIAMGEAGLLSRILALRYDNCLLTFATLGRGGRTAPGQLPVTVLHAVYHAPRIGSHTAIFGLLSVTRPSDARLAALNAATRAAGFDGVWVPFVATGQNNDSPIEVVQAFRRLGVVGYLIDESLQGDLSAAIDEVESRGPAQKINVLYQQEERLVGVWTNHPDEAVALLMDRSTRSLGKRHLP